MRWMLGAGATLATLGMVLHTLPYLIRDQAVIWLRSQGVEQASLRAIDVNWWCGEIQLRELKAHRQGHTPLDVGRLKVRLDYQALADRQLRIRVLQLEDVVS